MSTQEAFEQAMDMHLKARTDARAFVRSLDGKSYVYQLTNTAWESWQDTVNYREIF